MCEPVRLHAHSMQFSVLVIAVVALALMEKRATSFLRQLDGHIAWHDCFLNNAAVWAAHARTRFHSHALPQLLRLLSAKERMMRA